MHPVFFLVNTLEKFIVLWEQVKKRCLQVHTIEISKQNAPRVSKLNDIDAYNVVTHTHIAFYLKNIFV